MKVVLMEALRKKSWVSFYSSVQAFWTCLALVCLTAQGQQRDTPPGERHAQDHRRFAAQFKPGDTNTPLLVMDWVTENGAVYFCRVSQSGNVNSARDTGYAIQGGSGISSRFSLNSTNRPLLEAAMNALPVTSTKTLPRERQILVSGIRSNQWFDRVYDRADVPKEVEELYELTGAYLGWFIPKVETSVSFRIANSNFTGGFVAAASEADIAVFAGRWATDDGKRSASVMEFWRLKDGIHRIGPAFGALFDAVDLRQGSVVSPDGTVIAAANFNGLYVVDGTMGKMLWQTGPLDYDNYHGTTLAIGDKGRTLYSSGAHIVQRWDLLSGRKLGILCTNELIVKFLQTSRDGSLLVAGFGKFNDSATSFAVWESGKNEPAAQFSSPNGATVGISPDGQTLVLCHGPDRKFELLNWKKGEKVQVPFRVPYAAGSTHSIHWSPDGERLAAYVDSYPISSIIVYETKTWKPLAQWACGKLMKHSDFVVTQDGKLLQLTGAEINGLDLGAIKGIAE